MTSPQLALFCDFDGTVAVEDVGYRLYHRFSGGRIEALLPDWKAGRLSTRECLRQEAAMVSASPSEILDFVDRCEIEATFPTFAQLCHANRVPLHIVSEGLDFYIKRLMSKCQLDDIPVMCNSGYLENNTLRIEFPHTTRVCPGCGNCKAARLDEYRQAADRPQYLVFVGDGYSDACAAKTADLVFAKKDLETYCQAEKIQYNKYVSFEDVATRLQQMGHLNGA